MKVVYSKSPSIGLSPWIRGFKTNKAAGLKKISARLLKDSSGIISPVLQYLINLSIDQNSFPNSWKSAKVVALFKNGDSGNCDNYRPIFYPSHWKQDSRTCCLLTVLCSFGERKTSFCAPVWLPSIDVHVPRPVRILWQSLEQHG